MAGKANSSIGGFALILVLAFVFLLTIVVVAFLNRSIFTQEIAEGSDASFQAEQLSISALDLILADLRAEMAAGSTEQTADSIIIYKPSGNSVMVPYRSISSNISMTDPNFINLVKQSLPGVRFFPSAAPYNLNNSTPVLTGASAISVTTPSTNGRAISPSVWNLPVLLGGSGFTASQLPNWIYYSNQAGVISAVTPSHSITGRFAYNIYNIGGLLNVNAAGGTGTPTSAQIAALKGTLAGSDLSQIPGITSAGITALVNWRNSASNASLASYTSYATGLGPLSGFISPQTGDKIFVNRQDLIRWVNGTSTGQSDGNIASTALPFLTQFSRFQNSPSFNPSTPTGSTINYAAQADTNGVSNRFSPNVRVISTFTRADGSSAVVGEPLIKRRFPLSRLVAIGQSGINSTVNSTLNGSTTLVPANASTVQRDFGLVWNNAANPNGWTYVGGYGNTPQGTIETLDVVASENREPNFFEMLKAAILSGSLGNNGGISNSNTVTFDQNVDYQIIKIGLNTIDQFRPDDYPTTVAFDVTNLPAPFVFAGSTNLPTLNKMIRLIYRPPSGTKLVTSSGTVTQSSYFPIIAAWYVPELWNPYQTSLLTTNTTGASTTALRIRANDGDTAQFSPAVFDYTYGSGTRTQASLLSISDSISFSQTSGNSILQFANSASFAIPQVLAKSSGITATGYPTNGAIPDPSTNGFGTLYGIYVGTENIPDTRCGTVPPSALYIQGAGAASQQVLDSAYIGTSALTFFVEYQDPSNTSLWHPYDILKKLASSTQQQGTDGCNPSSDAAPNSDIAYNATYLPGPFQGAAQTQTKPVPCSAAERIDPRTDRFGASNGYATQLGYLRASMKNGTSYSNPATLPSSTPSWPKSYDPTLGGTWMRGVNGYQNLVGGGGALSTSKTGWFNASDGWGNHVGALTDNKPGSNMYYDDRDGVQRRAAGAYADCYLDNSAMAPVMLNRPFYSVGDLGYVNRDEPWKDINFFTTESADSALLDYFTAYEEPAVTAGRISINTAPVPVLESILSQSIETEAGAITQLATSDVTAIASALNAQLANTPLNNVSDLVGSFASNSSLAAFTAKAKRETYIRALAPVADTRTWNFLIDLVAQSGQFAPNSTTLDKFIVQGEHHVWLSVALDRFTGQIIAQQVEVISE